jgi:hypothetical protein
MTILTVESILDELRWLTPDKKLFLARLGTDSPASLWAQIDASPEPFIKILGDADTKKVANAMWKMIPPAERRILQESPFVPPPPGTVLAQSRLSGPSAPKYDVAKRDLLYARLKALKGQASAAADTEAESIRRELTALLKGENA